ncbi:ABC-type glycerol-3-phosphate transport system, substrate-binding protein [Paenibacillus sp. UNCCL117]|uniref:extracellular solute-binding protein n=1 Tax=unclassified Paenibacillus TaxID=185978 RepID=UPI0008855528|nr:MULTISPECIES: extracellular solute-binding protein [unclassified Paenibacillus]SDD18189.1 ABC-type glycerol-3-phosphate transport system, substrate-binding protein [Paenibacillus sp. cl123]SFW35164.1 ABC-type glycerol-3-phosphate transport system, substrate-binding protein [Paenibacillus sp. UNCCL117]
MSKALSKGAGSIAAVLTLGTVLAACSGGAGPAGDTGAPDSSGKEAPKPAAAAGPWKVGSEPFSFSLYGNYGWYTMPVWGKDLFSKAVQEKLKLNITAINSGGNQEAKLNTMIVGGDLPDVIWGDRPDFDRLIANGALVPLDPYLDKYPNLKKWAGDEILNMLRYKDGKLYLFPNWYTNKPTGNAGYVVNKKIYNELGKPKLETLDDLYSYLKLVKEKYPNVIPLEPGQAKDGKGVDILYSAFAENNPASYAGTLRAVPKDGKFTSLFADPVYKEAMVFVNKLHREKLMTQDALTQTVDQVREKINTGRVAVYVDVTAIEYASKGHALLSKDDPNAGYFMIWPIHKAGLDKNKITVAHYDRLGWNAAAITTKAKDPEKIFAVLDWMTSPEGMREIVWGPEGMYWQGVDSEGLPNLTDKFFAEPEERMKNMNATNDLQFVGNATYNDKIKVKAELSLPEEKRSWETKYQDSITWKTHLDLTAMRGIEPPKDSPEGVIRERWIELYKKVRGQAMLAGSEQEVIAIIEKGEKDAQALGVGKLLDYLTAKWKENEAKMKKK